MRYKSYIASTTSKDDPRFKDLYLFHGKSAYQAAVEMGYEGTEEEWIDSLTELRWGSLEGFKSLSNTQKQQTIAYIDTLAGKIYRYDEKTQEFVDTEISTYDKEGNAIHTTFLKRSGGIMTGENPILFELSAKSAIDSNHIRFNSGNDRIGADSSGNLGMFASGRMIEFRADCSNLNRGAIITHDAFSPTDNNVMNLGSETHQWANIYIHKIVGKMGSAYWGITSGLDEQLNGHAEIFTKDTGSEPIYARQYREGSILHELALLDKNGNTRIPNDLEIAGSLKMNNGRYINVGTAVTASRQLFDGTSDIDIPITAVNPEYITQSSSYRLVNDSQIASWDAKPTQSDVDLAFANLINGSPELLDTLSELSKALGDDPNFATTMATELGKKLDKTGGTITGSLKIDNRLDVSHVYGDVSHITTVRATDIDTVQSSIHGTCVIMKDDELDADTNTIGCMTLKMADADGRRYFMCNNSIFDYSAFESTDFNYDEHITDISTIFRLNRETHDIEYGGSLLPLIHNTKDLGSENQAWANVYATTFHGNATSANGLTAHMTMTSPEELDAFMKAGNMRYGVFQFPSDTEVVQPSSDTDPEFTFKSNNGMIVSIPWSDTTNGAQIMIDDLPNPTIAIRSKSTDGWGGWRSLIHTGNFTDYAAKKDHTHNYLLLTGGTITGSLTLSSSTTSYGNITLNRRTTSGSTYPHLNIGLTRYSFSEIADIDEQCPIRQIPLQNVSGLGDPTAYAPILGGHVGLRAWGLIVSNNSVGFAGHILSDEYWTALWDCHTGNFTNTGSITGYKIFNATWNDYAEWYEREDVEEVFEAGDIVTWSEDGVVKTTEAFDPCVVGVYSDTYGHIVGGEWLDNMEDNIEKHVPVGLCGRVHVKVVGKANRGDLIVSSDIPGVGMAISPKDAYPGVVIGKVLKKKETEEIEKIKIQIMLQ